jgi:hypothetical protein
MVVVVGWVGVCLMQEAHMLAISIAFPQASLLRFYPKAEGMGGSRAPLVLCMLEESADAMRLCLLPRQPAMLFILSAHHDLLRPFPCLPPSLLPTLAQVTHAPTALP